MIVAAAKNRRIQVRKPSKSSWTKARRARFLVALAGTCNVRHASTAIGISTRTAYAYRARDAAFAAAWAEAMAAGYDRLEGELLARALGEPGAERMEAEEALSEAADASGDPMADGSCTFDADLALKMLAQRNAALRAGGVRGGPKPAGHVTIAALEMALLRRLDAVARRLIRNDRAEAQRAARHRARQINGAVACEHAAQVSR